MSEKIEFSYFSLSLKSYFQDVGDERANDAAFINERAALAEEAFEERRRDGMTVDQAQELAMAVLMEGLSNE